jgi:hypothetical protein
MNVTVTPHLFKTKGALGVGLEERKEGKGPESRMGSKSLHLATCWKTRVKSFWLSNPQAPEPHL